MKLTILFILIFVAGVAVDASAMRCGDRLVSPGDTKAEVFVKCGEPSFSDVVALETSKRDGNQSSVVEVPVEQWTYNQGPNTLLKVLTFKGGVLVTIRDGDRVLASPGEKQIFAPSLGDSQADVLQKYGEPLFRDVVGTETVKSLGHDGQTVAREVKVERWTYSFGPGTFLKILTFKNGQLVEIEDGDRQ